MTDDELPKRLISIEQAVADAHKRIDALGALSVPNIDQLNHLSLNNRAYVARLVDIGRDVTEILKEVCKEHKELNSDAELCRK
jgi:hypothetical protein